MKANVFCIVGKTGSGKTKVLNELIQDKFFMNETKLHKVVYWTTRMPRMKRMEKIIILEFTIHLKILPALIF